MVSNNETLNLMWRVTFPGMLPINFTYDSTSKLESVDYLSMNISAILTHFSNESIESVIVLTVMRNVSMNGTRLMCSFTDSTYDMAIVNTIKDTLG